MYFFTTANLSRVKWVILVLAVSFFLSSLVFYSNKTNNVKNAVNAVTNEERLEILRSYGYEVDPTPLETEQITIPAEFNDVYEGYNEIQKKNGFDLGRYKGKKATRYSYVVTNYKNSDEDVTANLIFYKNKLIAGDISSPKLNGFMHGLDEPPQSAG